MANFSNHGVDTFDPDNDYIGVRLQQGVPLLDRDWNELEDIRRHIERMLAKHYIGDGVPDPDGFAVTALEPPAANEILVGAGRCMVDGLELVNRDTIAFSEQGDGVALPPPSDTGEQVLLLYLEPTVARVDSAEIPALGNPQDIGIETCVRDQLRWAVRVIAAPAVPPPDTYTLAIVRRAAGEERVTADDITDARRTGLSVAATVERAHQLAVALAALQARVDAAEDRIEDMQADLDRLFWQVTVTPQQRQALFGERVSITIKVTNRRGEPIQGATVAVSTDWGQVSLASSITDANGAMAADIVGVRGDVYVRPNDIAQLGAVTAKVKAAMVPAAIAATTVTIQPIQYARLRFDPGDLELLSRYSPTASLTDLSAEIPRQPEVLIPKGRTATVTVHVKESPVESIVKATGNVQIQFGEWVRDWLRTKVFEMTESLHIGARVGDILRQGVQPGGVFDHDSVVKVLMPGALQQIDDDTTTAMKATVFGDAGMADTDLRGSGKLGQVLAEEVTAAVGATTHQVVVAQMSSLVASKAVPADAASVAQQQLIAGSAQVVAGLAQSKKQLFARISD